MSAPMIGRLASRIHLSTLVAVAGAAACAPEQDTIATILDDGRSGRTNPATGGATWQSDSAAQAAEAGTSEDAGAIDEPSAAPVSEADRAAMADSLAEGDALDAASSSAGDDGEPRPPFTIPPHRCCWHP